MAKGHEAGAGPAELEISRVFDASPDRVFRAWTEPEQVKRWWGPNGFTTPVCTIDLRPGGTRHYCMRSSEGRDYWCKGSYREIIKAERIVSTDSFSDAEGNLVPPTHYGMSTDWPAETLVTVTFAGQDGRTTLTIRQSVPESLAKESGAVQGWSESLDRLAEHLKSVLSLCPMTAEPQQEHQWLQRMVGEWTSEAVATMEPGQPPATVKGSEAIRSLGGLWVMAEGQGEMPGGGAMTSMMTLGYDPRTGRYVGTFIASMMTHLWVYEGALDDAGRVLTLDTQGPDFASGGKTMARYQDAITFESNDHRVLTSRMLGDDGQWRQIMTAHYWRTV